MPHVGDVLAEKYRIVRLLGQGGMGAVFEAEDEVLHRAVAVKVLLEASLRSADLIARFLNEARAAAKIDSDHVTRIMDVGKLTDGSPFIVLELLKGDDFASLLATRGPLPIADVARYVQQALKALALAHGAGIIHRDLKPANLFLAQRQDGAEIVKVLDFGISKFIEPFGSQPPASATSSQALLGSPPYMSPEQLRDPKSVGARTDIWSLGVILYELSTARLPFAAATVAELFVAILEAKPVPLAEVRADVPPGFAAVVMRCLAKEPKDRFSTAGDLADALEPFVGDMAAPATSVATSRSTTAETDLALAVTSIAPSVRPPAEATPTPSAPGRRPRPRAALILGLMALLGVIGLSTWLGFSRSERIAPSGGAPVMVVTANPSLEPFQKPPPAISIAPLPSMPSAASTVSSTPRAALPPAIPPASARSHASPAPVPSRALSSRAHDSRADDFERQ